MISLYLLGLVLGVCAALAPGPINLETVRLAIARGPKIGLAFGLGAVTADTLCCFLMFMGATSIYYNLSPFGKGNLGMVSAAMITFIGVRALLAKVKPPASTPEEIAREVNAPADELFHPVWSLVKRYGMGFGLTLFSPVTIGFWVVASVSAAKYAGDSAEMDSAPLLAAAGVATVCSLWVTAAVNIAGRYHKQLDAKTYLRVERVVGALLLVVAAFSTMKAVDFYMGKEPESEKRAKAAMEARPRKARKGLLALDGATTGTQGNLRSLLGMNPTTATIAGTLPTTAPR